jgi:hypothetical protein
MKSWWSLLARSATAILFSESFAIWKKHDSIALAQVRYL